MEKITLEEFWNDKKSFAIHTKTKEQASLLCEAFKKMDKKWYKSEIHIHDRAWEIHEENGCYTNHGQFGDINKLKFFGYKIYEFENIDLTVKEKDDVNKKDISKEEEEGELGDK